MIYFIIYIISVLLAMMHILNWFYTDAKLTGVANSKSDIKIGIVISFVWFVIPFLAAYSLYMTAEDNPETPWYSHFPEDEVK